MPVPGLNAVYASGISDSLYEPRPRNGTRPGPLRKNPRRKLPPKRKAMNAIFRNRRLGLLMGLAVLATLWA
jgi:hypothetical protein